MTGIRRRKSSFSALHNSGYRETYYCDRCYEVGAPCELGPRIMGPNEVRPKDDDNFRQCRTCGTVYALFELKHIDDSNPTDLQPVTNPFDTISTVMQTTGFSQRGRKYFAKKMKQDQRNIGNQGINRYYVNTSEDEKDKDIASFRQKGDIVRNIRDVS